MGEDQTRRVESRSPGRGWAGWRSVVGIGLLMAGLPMVSSDLESQETAPPSPERGGDPQEGELEVRVDAAADGSPIRNVLVRLPDLGRIASTGAEGRAVFRELEPRTYTVRVEHLGYRPQEEEVDVVADERVVLEVSLETSPLDIAGLVVTGTARERGMGEVYRPTASLSGDELQRSMASSVPATVSRVPGVSLEYSGPGATSPLIRGMGNDRVLMLEDGNRSGDIYSSGADHGVMIEPLSAERTEVVRGPATLLYGSQALGGVVNVIREDVPTSRPSGLRGRVGTQLESVSDGTAGMLELSGPAGPLAVRGQFSARRHDDTRTPLGTLDQSSLDAYSGTLGTSLAGDRGYAGVALHYYTSSYGVPGEFDGELIPGGHPGGVDIEVDRVAARFRAELRDDPLPDFFRSVELRANVTDFEQEEIEGTVDGERIAGALFDQRSVEASLIAHHDHDLHEHPRHAVRLEGAWGVSADERDLWTGGVSPGARTSLEQTYSAFGFEELGIGDVRLQAGLRYDYRRSVPADRSDIRVRSQEGEQIVRSVSARNFSELSGSLSARWDFAEGFTAGVSGVRAVRMPALEELFSDGPHLADFSYDVGDPTLEPETGMGLDVFVRSSLPRLDLEAAAFYNRVDGYINQLWTGLTRVEQTGGSSRVVPIYLAQADDAEFAGLEGRIQWEALPDVVLDGTADYTRASRAVDGDPLPDIPPLSGHFDVRYEGDPFTASLGVRAASSQRRVPAPMEVQGEEVLPQQPTDGYALLNAGVGWRLAHGGMSHRVMLQIENLTDRDWRDHLSRMKELAPNPGRNVQLTYTMRF